MVTVKKAAPKKAAPKKKPAATYVVVRSRDAGAFLGRLVRRNGSEVELADARRLWYWDGAAWSTDGVTIINNDVANHTLTVSMTHFSFYAFFAAAPTGLDPGDEPEAPFRLYLPNVNK